MKKIYAESGRNLHFSLTNVGKKDIYMYRRPTGRHNTIKNKAQ